MKYLLFSTQQYPSHYDYAFFSPQNQSTNKDPWMDGWMDSWMDRCHRNIQFNHRKMHSHMLVKQALNIFVVSPATVTS